MAFPRYCSVFSRTPKCPASYLWVYDYPSLGITGLEEKCIGHTLLARTEIVLFSVVFRQTAASRRSECSCVVVSGKCRGAKLAVPSTS
jgi:hypothetical protein